MTKTGPDSPEGTGPVSLWHADVAMKREVEGIAETLVGCDTQETCALDLIAGLVIR